MRAMSTSGNSYGHSTLQLPSIKRKRNLPGTPDPEAEVVVLSPEALMATNRFVCNICQKGFQRDQNLQLHRRGHNLPWKLGRHHRPPLDSKEDDDNCRRKRVYVCPEPDCVHHDPSRALGDLTGIKKHFFRKHGEKKWKCNKCNKLYAVQSDWKAHSKTCGTREYQCDCGAIFCRKDSFVTHRAFCEALAEESARMSSTHPNGETSSTREATLMKENSTDHIPSSNNIGMLDSSPNINIPVPLNGNGFLGSTNQSITTSRIPPTKNNPPPLLSLWPGSLGGSLSNSGSFPSIRKSGFESRGMESNLAGIPILAGNNNSNSNSTLANIFPSNNKNCGMLDSYRGLLHASPTSTTTTQAGLSISYTQQGIVSPGNAEKSRSCSTTLSATALLQKAAQMGATMSSSSLFRGFRMMPSDSLEAQDVTTSAPPCRGGSLFGVGMSTIPSLPRPSLLGPSLIAPSLLGPNMASMNRVLSESQTGQSGVLSQLEWQKDGSDRMTVDFLGVGGRSSPRIIGGLVGQIELSHSEIQSTIASFPE